MNNIRELVRQFIISDISSEEEAEGITDETDLKESGILESLSTLKLVSFLEEKFGIEIQADDIEAGHLSSLSRIERFVKARGEKKL